MVAMRITLGSFEPFLIDQANVFACCPLITLQNH